MDDCYRNSSEFRDRLCDITVEFTRTANGNVESEIGQAVSDLIEDSYFELIGRDSGPYVLNLSLIGGRFTLNLYAENGSHIVSHILSLSPLRRILKEYKSICEALQHAAMSADTYRVEAIDMARRAIHNQGSEIVRERLSSKIRTDLDTARKLFTIISVANRPTWALQGANAY